MRRAVLAIALLLALAASAQPAAAATKKERQRICAQRGATVASSKLARVFEVDRQGNRSLFACLRSNGRLQLLSSWFSCDCSTGDEPSPLADLHAGRFVELTEFESCGPVPDPTCGGSTVTVRDLRARRDFGAAGPIGQLVARGSTFAFTDGRVLLVLGGVASVVDPGPGIEAGSLALARTRLYWTRDGAPFSAPLQ